MADSSDVENALVSLLAPAIQTASAELANARVYRGWPQSALLDADLDVGIAHVTVTATAYTQNVTRHLAPPPFVRPGVATLSAALDGGMITFSGAGGAGQVVGVLANNIAYAYRLVDGDTPASTAAAMAQKIPQATASAAVLRAPGVTAVRIGVDSTATRELKREERRFQIMLWCPSPDMRDRAGGAADQCLAAMPFLSLMDGSRARLRASGETVNDKADSMRLWRRDLLYDVEFLTTVAEPAPQMLFGTTIARLDNAEALQMGDMVMPDTAETDASGNVLGDAAGHPWGDFT